MAIFYLKKIEKEINDLFGGEEVYKWQQIYEEYDGKKFTPLKNNWKNPRNAFIIMSAVIYLMIILACIIITIMSHFSCIFKVPYIIILLILTALVYPSLDNSHVR